MIKINYQLHKFNYLDGKNGKKKKKDDIKIN